MVYKIPSNPRILLSNDDGIYAPGLAVLEEIARQISDDVWVVAPLHEQSGASHSLSLRNPLRITQRGEKRFSVEGTPTDCVLIAINNIMEKHRPDLVLSGVNLGSNLGEDVTYSGTIAAAMEATLLGVPAIAMSQVVLSPQSINWDVAKYFGPDLVNKLLKLQWQKDVLMSVNFPDVAINDVKGFYTAHQGRRKLGEALTQRVDPRGLPYYWIGVLPSSKNASEGTDLWAVQNDYISVTPLHLDLTHHASFKSLQAVLGE